MRTKISPTYPGLPETKSNFAPYASVAKSSGSCSSCRPHDSRITVRFPSSRHSASVNLWGFGLCMDQTDIAIR